MNNTTVGLTDAIYCRCAYLFTNIHMQQTGLENIVIFSKISKTIENIENIFDIFDIFQINENF